MEAAAAKEKKGGRGEASGIPIPKRGEGGKRCLRFLTLFATLLAFFFPGENAFAVQFALAVKYNRTHNGRITRRLFCPLFCGK